MGATSSELNPLVAADHTVSATFRRKYGIPPKGPTPKGGWADSDYGLPLPPAGHPMAVPFARAVLRRAHQATRFDPDDVAKQVRKAKAILAKHNGAKKESAVLTWREVRWVNAARPRGAGFAAVHPRASETLRQFLERVPGALPAAKAKRGARMRESATLVRAGHALHERLTSPAFLREADASTGDVVKNVLLIRSGPGNPSDRHYYTDACLQDAVKSGVFEGARAFFDHPSTLEEQTRPERSVRDLCGWYSNVSCRSYTDPALGQVTGVWADFHPAVGNDEVMSILRTCIEYAKTYPRMAYAGLSINAIGDGEPAEIGGEEYNRVDVISAVESVDIVTRAGAGGAITPLKESWSMKTTTSSARSADGLKLTLDTEEVRRGLREQLKRAKDEIKSKILGHLGENGAAVQLTPEQDAELDRTLGIVDGGALDTVLDQATGVADDDDDDDDPEEGARARGEATAPNGAGDAPSADLEGANIETMTHEQLKAHAQHLAAKLQAARAQAEAAEKRERDATREASRAARERMADNVLTELNIPEAYRPRLKYELVREGYRTDREMREHAQQFDKTFIRTAGAVGVAPGSRTSDHLTAASFSFGEDD